VHKDTQEVYGSHRALNNSSAEVCQGTVGCDCSIDFLPDAKYLSAVEKSAFADILDGAAW